MQSAPNRLENLRTLKMANLDGAFATAFATLVGGAFMVGYVKLLGGSDIWIGVLTAIPSLLGIVQVPGAIWGRSHSSFKQFVAPGGLAWRFFYIPFAVLPLIALADATKLWILGASVAIASFCVLLVNPIYNDWLAELVPSTSRGWFFSRRNAIMAGVGTVAGTLGGLILDSFKSRGEAEHGFALVFAFGLVCAAISYAFFMRMHDIRRANPVRQDMRKALAALKRPLANPKFRPVLVFFIAAVFAQTYPGNLFGAYALESLHLPFTVIQLAAAAQALGTILAGAGWGYLADKYGNRPLLLLLGLGIALTPLPWILTRPGDLTYNVIVLLVGHVYSGIMWGGVTVCQFNLLLATSDPDDRATYIGLGLAAQAIVGGIAPLVGAETLAQVRAHFGAGPGYAAIFWSTVGLRTLATLFLLPIKEPGAIGIRETFGKLRRFSPRGYAALRNLSSGSSPSRREEAIQAVASHSFTLASEEIVAALHDPSPRVRRQAAMALSKIGDEQAVDALVHQLEEHPDLIEDEILEALGDLGDKRAVPAIIRQLRSPRSSTRRSAAKALGSIGDPEAVQPLIEAASDEGDADLRRAALQALRSLDAQEAAPAVLNGLLDPYPSVRIAAAEAAVELELKEAVGPLRESLQRYEDEAESEIAYALGRLGEPSDLPAILGEARKCVSVTTRRRCLLGVARLLGVENEVYRLLLMEGMSRDAAIFELWGPLIKRSRRLHVALHRYAAGAEVEAIELAAATLGSPLLKPLAEQPVDELFLVVAAFARKAAKRPTRTS